ncbi:MAG: bifunctional hydroxymethylpyrimidine kinase/phosphomethylpyrimidine kinase [Pseudomonadota bacterium]
MIALTIAGSDSGGGAGIQADLKTFSALGVYGASVITALTAQNTRGVSGVTATAPDMVRAQLDAVLSDLDVRAVKIGMVADGAVIEAIAERLGAAPFPVVVDPVMVAASGDRLIDEGAESALRDLLLPLATIATPNLPEAAVLTGQSVAKTLQAMEAQARTLERLGPSVLLKGGHLGGATSPDVFISGGKVEHLSAPRVATDNTHGTGCTLSSAIAAGLAKGMALPAAVHQAKDYLSAAISAADRLRIGSGRGPVHHFHALWPKAGEMSGTR